MQGDPGVEPVQQVLPTTDHLEGARAAQVQRRQAGEAQVAEDHLGPGQGSVEPVGGAPDGVTLRHDDPRPQVSPEPSPAQPQPARRRVETGVGQG